MNDSGHARSAAQEATQRPTRRFADVQIGDELPPFDLEISPTVIVAGAMASRDYMPVHHDAAFARKAGAKDIFMNILTTNGYVARYVTDWAGPEAMLRSVAFRLGVPNYPDDHMILTGRVVSKDEGLVHIEFTGRNGIGDHVSGTVVVDLP